MAKKEYGVYLKDGRFIRLFGGLCTTGTGAMPNITSYVNESFGDDFIPDLEKVGDVQYFASGAKMEVIGWGDGSGVNRKDFLINIPKKNLGRAKIKLYRKDGSELGKIELESLHSPYAYNKLEFVVGIFDYYNLFNTSSYPSGFNFIRGNGFLGKDSTFNYEFSDGQSSLLSDVENKLKSGTYNKGFV